MRGFGFLLIGGVSSLGVAVSTAILRHVLKRPPSDHFKLTSGDDSEVAAEKNTESYLSSEENMDVPGATALHPLQAETPLLKMMREENKTEFTYDSCEYAVRYGEDFYSDGRSPRSQVMSPDSKASESTVVTRSFSDDDIGTDDICDQETVSETVISDREEPPIMRVTSPQTQDSLATEDILEPEINESSIVGAEICSSAATEYESSRDGTMEQAYAFLATQVTNIKENPATGEKTDMARSRSSSIDGSIEPYLEELVSQDTWLLCATSDSDSQTEGTDADSSFGEEASVSDDGIESAEPYMTELLDEDDHTMAGTERRDRMIQTEAGESLSSQSTPTKESVSNAHGSPSYGPIAGMKKESGCSGSGPLITEKAKVRALVRSESMKRVPSNGDLEEVSGPQGFDEPTIHGRVSVVPIPIPRTWPQAEERSFEMGRQGTRVGGVLQGANGDVRLTGMNGPSVATGVVQMSGTMKSSGLLPSIGGGGKENMVKRLSGLGGRPSSSRTEEARGSKRFRFAERIWIRPLRTRSSSSKS